MTKMEIYLIESFLAFAGAKNMRDAASSLGLSQPALSLHLRRFEASFATPVFSSIGRKKVMTPFGLELKSRLQKRMDAVRFEMAHAERFFADPKNAKINIAGRSEVINRFAIHLKFPGSLEFSYIPGALATKAVISRKADLAISNHLEGAENLIARPCFTENFSICFPKSWSSNKSASKTAIEDLISRPYISYQKGDVILKNLLDQHGFNKEISARTTIGNWDQVTSLVTQERGWTICPNYFIPPSNVGTWKLSSSAAPEAKFYVLYRKEMKKVAWFSDLVEQILEAFKT